MPTGSRRTLMRLHSALVLVLTTVAQPRRSCGRGKPASRRTRARELRCSADITRENVSRLQPAWTFHSRDFSGGRGPEPGRAVPGVQVRPVFADGRLYITTPSSIVIALDGDTGERSGASIRRQAPLRACYEPHRGVALWPASSNGATGARTVFSGTCDGRLIALDAATGKPANRLRRRVAASICGPGADARPGEAYAMTSPPAIYRDLVIAGALAPEGVPRGPAGDVRAFDARTGRERVAVPHRAASGRVRP